ncbi:negative regulator of mitosis [Phyllosticta citriasiana]|uniref:negative regulator of mitosis n=1 Tax=Phyllosticta citriasiana TaxID=595635 RepID=UPI0030FD5FEA
MASIRSLGVHTPAALPYLIAEGYLPENAPPEAYTWDTYNDDGGDEEITYTDICVVWARGGVVRKAFNFSVEEEKVLQAVLTWFPSDETDPSSSLKDDKQEGKFSRALAVFLKTQAHIFFLAGSTHVVNLPFEVERVFPAPRGLLIQRKISTLDISPTSPLVPTAPPNSFFTSQPTQSFSQTSSKFAFGNALTPRRSRSTNLTGFPSLFGDLLKSGNNPAADGLPRLFSFTDPFSEMGLVVAAQSTSMRASFSARRSSSKTVEPVDKSEEVLYVTKQNEVQNAEGSNDKPLILVVTANYDKRAYSVWYASYVDPKPASAKRGRRTSFSASRSRRRSSYNPGTGATTPLSTRGGFRESFGPGRSQMASSFNGSQTREPSGEQTAEEAFASQLDPETDLASQPSRASRRVSSLISRADLSSSFDKSAFQDLATHRAGFRDSLGIHGRRGQSLGGIGRTSIGPSSRPVSRKTRASTPGDVSQISLVAVSLDDNLDDGLDDTLDDSQIPDEILIDDESGTGGLQEPVAGLRRELVLVKFSEIPFGNSESIFRSSASFKLSDQAKIFTLRAPQSFTESATNDGRFFIYMMQKSKGELVEHEFIVQRRRLPLHGPDGPRGKAGESSMLIPIGINTQRQLKYADATRIYDEGIERVLTLSKDGPNGPVLNLFAGWCPRARVTLALPAKLRVVDPDNLEVGLAPLQSMEHENRLLDTPKHLQEFAHSTTSGIFCLRDESGHCHRLQTQLWPANDIAMKVLRVCRLVLPFPQGEHILAIWWDISRNLQGETRFDIEWASMISALFTFAVSSIDPQSVRLTDTLHSVDATPSRRSHKKHSSEEPFDLMWRYVSQDHAARTWDGPAWAWVEQALVDHSKSARSGQSQTSAIVGLKRKSDFIPFCAKTAREFLHQPLGQSLIFDATGRTTRSKHSDSHATHLPSLLVALHLLREESKLNLLTKDFKSCETGNLAPVLAQLGRWLDWDFWDWRDGNFFGLDGGSQDHWVYEDDSITTVTLPNSPWEKPPTIFEWLESTLSPHGFQNFPTLDMLVGSAEKSTTSFASQTLARVVTELTPRTVALCLYLTKIRKRGTTSSAKVEMMISSGIDHSMLETFPAAVVAGMHEAIVECQASPPTTWNDTLLEIVGREDLHMLLKPHAEWSPSQSQPTNAVATRDVHSVCQTAEASDSIQTSSEADRHMITRLIFSEDRRYIEALRLLEPLRPAVAECTPDPSWTEAEHLDAQQSVMQWVMLRTFALPPGHSMLQFDSKRPMVTEKYPLHGFTTLCIMKPLNNTVSADRTTYTEEKFAWAFFHAGVSAGLSISKQADGIDTSWIAFNKPPELSNKHAGLLFGLGLNGHLKKVAKWLSFKYLTPKHSMTSIGLLLGLSVSYMGTMDTLVTRLLSVHVTRMLPPGAADLNLPPLAQTSGLMGIGLLYLNTQHRRMSEIMLSEIEHVELEDPSAPRYNVRDEGYRLAAGFSLGLINLGQGNDLKGLHDMRLVERLLAVAVGPRPVDIVHILDQATAGAVIAVALIFMKTNNWSVAQRINIPDTLPQFDYVRADMFLLRTLARHLIMWDDIRADHAWILKNLPPEYGVNHTLKQIKVLRSEYMPFYNIVAGLLWSISLKCAGTGDVEVRDFLVEYLDQFIRISHLPAMRYDARLTRHTVRNCQDLIALAAATVMAGTGDIVVFRRLRLLHGRVSPDVPYGSHFAAHMAIGALFLAGGSYTFGTSNLAIAALVCAFYPLFPTDVLDNKAHLQAFRHFWVLASEPRCLIVRDVETHRAISLPFVLQRRDGDGSPEQRTAPCLLPDLDTIASLRTASPDYWPVTLDFSANAAHRAAFARQQTIHVRRRPAHEAHSSTFAATLSALNDAQAAATQAAARAMWEWVFGLPALREEHQPNSNANAAGAGAGGAAEAMTTPNVPILSRADIGLVLPPDPHSSTLLELRGTVVDDRLALRAAAQSAAQRCRLEELRLLFRWAEREAEGGGRLRWLGREVVEGLRGVVEERGRMIVEGV